MTRFAFRPFLRPLLSASSPRHPRTPSSRLLSSTSFPSSVKIVEVGPRDGLQNEKTLISAELKLELIERLAKCGLKDLEIGSLVSPKWVPQMATTPSILESPRLSALISSHPDLSLPILIPNSTGLKNLLALPQLPPRQREIAIFISASEGFSKANLNCSIEESLRRLEPVFGKAKEEGYRIRGYLSVVIGCPFEGHVSPHVVRDLSKTLLEKGCYEISLGDTIGTGTPASWGNLIDIVTGGDGKVGVEKLAAHCHDTYGSALANIFTAISRGVPTVDTSISSLGGCPFSPGATGNVATEDVVYSLESAGITTGILPSPSGRPDDLLTTDTPRNRAFSELVKVGEWISGVLERENGSRSGGAFLARERRLEGIKERERAGEKVEKL